METNNMIKRDIVERELHPVSGMAMMVISAVGILAGIGLCIAGPVMFDGGTVVLLATAGVLLFLVFLVCMCGLKIVNPNEALVLTLFGKYHGTIKKDGFFFVNPFVAGFNPTARGTLDTIKEEMVEASKKDGHKKSSKSNAGKKVSTKTMTLNNAQQKVNDVQGNPVVIGSIVIWRVANPTKAVFNVENYFEYLSIQCDSTIRNTARLYPYDTIAAFRSSSRTTRSLSSSLSRAILTIPTAPSTIFSLAAIVAAACCLFSIAAAISSE